MPTKISMVIERNNTSSRLKRSGTISLMPFTTNRNVGLNMLNLKTLKKSSGCSSCRGG